MKKYLKLKYALGLLLGFAIGLCGIYLLIK